MAEILADIHTAESVVEMNPSTFATDSARMALKQSILKRKGYTLAQLDTSFMWYGAHLKEYDKVYDKTLEILEGRLQDVQAMASSQSTMTLAGDSVDLWASATGFRINNLSPSPFTTFELKHDGNFKSGDSYTWRAKFTNNTQSARWDIVVDYTDGATEHLVQNFAGDGWREITFFTDSTRTTKNVSGALEIKPVNGTQIYVDSMQLIRNRLNPRIYPQRYRQQLFNAKSNQ